ncbi:hypothetical protein [Lutibaculum baratangense]|uniref:hypothetical protein n=1 Tax=Lutibaculum baratangense TaxID=1358440 RepID=UPI0013626FBD|nr:hypothetical protein [Lutibaculum baratangense]
MALTQSLIGAASVQTASHRHFSFRTPLNGFPSFLPSIKRPEPESRFVQALVVGLNV